MTAKTNNSVPDKEPDVIFEYRGLVFKFYYDTYGVLVKEGRRHVLKENQFAQGKDGPDYDSLVEKLKASIIDGVDRGFGLNVNYDRVEAKAGELKIGDVSAISTVQLELDEIFGKLSELMKTTTCCNVGEALAFVGFAHEQLEYYFEWAEKREAEGVKVE